MPTFTNPIVKFTFDARKATTTFTRLEVQLRAEPLAGPVPTVTPNPRPRLATKPESRERCPIALELAWELSDGDADTLTDIEAEALAKINPGGY